LAHHRCDRGVSGSQQQVEVVGQQGPCVASSLGCAQDRFQPVDEILAVGDPPEDLAAFDPPAMIWCKAPGASMRALRGMSDPYYDFFLNATHENRGVPYVVSFSIFPILFHLNAILGKTTNYPYLQ
jgi:hypothetical protein